MISDMDLSKLRTCASSIATPPDTLPAFIISGVPVRSVLVHPHQLDDLTHVTYCRRFLSECSKVNNTTFQSIVFCVQKWVMKISHTSKVHYSQISFAAWMYKTLLSFAAYIFMHKGTGMREGSGRECGCGRLMGMQREQIHINHQISSYWHTENKYWGQPPV